MLNFLTKGITKIFGTKSDKDIKQLTPYVAATNEEFVKLKDLSHDEFRAQTDNLKAYIAEKLSHIDNEVARHKTEGNNDAGDNIDPKELIFKKIDELEKKKIEKK